MLQPFDLYLIGACLAMFWAIVECIGALLEWRFPYVGIILGIIAGGAYYFARDIHGTPFEWVDPIYAVIRLWAYLF